MTTTDNEKIIALLSDLRAEVNNLRADMESAIRSMSEAPSRQPASPGISIEESESGNGCILTRTRRGKPATSKQRLRMRHQMWAEKNGPVGENTLVGTCPTADCVNPDHFILVHKEEARTAYSYVAALPLYQGLSIEDEAELERAIYGRCEEWGGHLIRKEGTNVMVELPGGRSIGIARALAYLEGLPGTEDGPFSVRRTCGEKACIAPAHHEATPMPEDTLDKCKVS